MKQLGLLFIIYILLALFVTIPVIIFLCIYYYSSKKYESSSYYKNTNTSYFKIRYDTGKYGEYLIYKSLKTFEVIGAKFLFNVYIPKKDEETTEIDVLMISRKGIFVFESKNYSGWIFGTDNQRYWYQTLPEGRRKSHKEKFYNPIFQNNTHVKYLKSLLGDNIPFYSIIAFSDRCTLKNINIQNSNVNVINRHQVYSLVSSIYNSNPIDSLTDAQVEEVYNILYPYTQVRESTKLLHIYNINNKLNSNNSIVNNVQNPTQNNEIVNQTVVNFDDNEIINIDSVTSIEKEMSSDIQDNNIENTCIESEKEKSLICPQCGSKLVLRKAKRGNHVGENFYGCSNYPKCKYIQKMEIIEEKE